MTEPVETVECPCGHAESEHMPETPTVGDIPGTQATCRACLERAMVAHRKGKSADALFAQCRHAFVPPAPHDTAPEEDHIFPDGVPIEALRDFLAVFPTPENILAFERIIRGEAEQHFEAVEAGEWIRPPLDKPFMFECCDCGLVHALSFDHDTDGRIMFSAVRAEIHQ
ncbi:MAG: hypothetical protein KGL39_35265 [Patescibacteria group bacterium]|nr:hypothetical protein [Patescibacteria group bacterium]